MTTLTIEQIAEILFSLLIALWGLYQNRKANTATTEKEAVVSYFTPGDDTVTKAPETLPGRSWKMDEGTKRWLTFDHSPIEQESLLKQVAEAESKRLDTYTITVPSAWYDIEYGLIKGSGKTGGV
jgi:hypothetical protein